MIRALLYSNIVVKNHRAEVTTVSGVIYDVLTPMSDFEWPINTPCGGGTKRLEIYHHISEQGQALYGFETVEARNVFSDLVAEVEGMGCAKALKVMSSAEPEKLVVDIANGNVEALTKVPGIGPKSAERIIVTLKDRYAAFSTKKDLGNVTALELSGRGLTDSTKEKFQEVRKTAELALVELGYTKRQSVAAVDKINWTPFLSSLDPSNNKLNLNNVLETVIKTCLHNLQKGV